MTTRLIHAEAGGDLRGKEGYGVKLTNSSGTLIAALYDGVTVPAFVLKDGGNTGDTVTVYDNVPQEPVYIICADASLVGGEPLTCLPSGDDQGKWTAVKDETGNRHVTGTLAFLRGSAGNTVVVTTNPSKRDMHICPSWVRTDTDT